MKEKKFLFFLIISLGLTAFLAGYIVVGRGTRIGSKTGTILDKFGSQQSTPSTGSGQATSDQQPAHESGLMPLVDRAVVSVTNSLNRGSILYFEKNTGKLYEYDLNSKTEKVISDKILPNFISALWSPAKEELLGSFTSNTGIIFKYINIKTGQEVALDPNIRSVAFSPDGNLMAYHYRDDATENDSGNITISQPNGQYQKKILATRIKDIVMSWPNKENMALKTPGQEIFFLNEAGNLTKVLDIKFGLEEKWSPSGNKLLFSALSDNPDDPDIKLWIKDMASKEEKELIPGSAFKCVWSIDNVNIYCAIAKSPSIDEIYFINTADGSNKLIAEPDTPIKELFLSTVEDRILFINAADEKLYSIKISE